MALGAIAALKEAGKLEQVKVGGFDGSPDAVAAVKAGEMQYTVLQPVAVFSAEAVRQADNFIKTGETGADSEKQLFDCVLITKDNADQMVAPFTLADDGLRLTRTRGRRRGAPRLRPRETRAMPSLLGIDNGLTVTKAVVFDADGTPLAVARRRVPQSIPRPRHVERDMDGLWPPPPRRSARRSPPAAGPPSDIAARRRHRARRRHLPARRATARPLGPAILSLDSRAGAIAEAWTGGPVADAGARAHRPAAARLRPLGAARLDPRPRARPLSPASPPPSPARTGCASA